MQTTNPIMMTREEAVAYINAATTLAERSARKALVIHILYNHPRPFKEVVAEWQARSKKK